MTLRCKNPECESRTGEVDGAVFNLTTTFDQNRELTERMRRVAAEEFQCAFCWSEGEEDPEKADGRARGG